MSEAEEIGKRLKDEWRKNNIGGCKIPSKGIDCECHLCLIDSLIERIKSEAVPNSCP